MKDITVILRDSPGNLSDLCEKLSEEGFYIEGISVITYKGECPIHILVEDAVAARKILGANWMDVIAEREALVKDISDQPGALGEISRRLADAGINIEVVYLTTKTKIALVVDDLEQARSLF
ncbi:MAG: ACT domain-containing protein [Anaerolineales bacterium]